MRPVPNVNLPQFGGFGLGTIITSAVFLGAIILIVAYMTFTRDGEEPAVES